LTKLASVARLCSQKPFLSSQYETLILLDVGKRLGFAAGIPGRGHFAQKANLLSACVQTPHQATRSCVVHTMLPRSPTDHPCRR